MIERRQRRASSAKQRSLTTIDSGLSTPPSSVLIHDIQGKKSENSNLKTLRAQSDWGGESGGGAAARTQAAGLLHGRLPQAGPKGFANREERKPNFDRGRGLGGGRRGIPKNP